MHERSLASILATATTATATALGLAKGAKPGVLEPTESGQRPHVPHVIHRIYSLYAYVYIYTYIIYLLI